MLRRDTALSEVPPTEAHWTLSCGHEIPRFEHQRRDKPPRRCPLCGTLQNVTVSIGASGEHFYECERCGFVTYNEDEMSQHRCRRWSARRVGKWIGLPDTRKPC